MLFDRNYMIAFILFLALRLVSWVDSAPNLNQTPTNPNQKSEDPTTFEMPQNSSSSAAVLTPFLLFQNRFFSKCPSVRSEGRSGCPRGWKNENSSDECTLPNYDNIFPCATSGMRFLNELDEADAVKPVFCSNERLTCLGNIELPGDVTRLFLNQNKLTDADQLKDTLRHLRNLVQIDLSSNDIQRIPRRLFEFNPALQEVRFERNFMVYIQEDTFANNFNLTEVYFAGNKLEASPWFLFEANAKLRVADFRNNNLMELPMDLFYDNPLLETVDFSSNRLKQIAVECFLANPNLKEVGLSSNYFSEVPSLLFEYNEKLVSLKLSHNRIQNLSSAFLQNSRDLERLYLSFNRISVVPNGFLRNNIKLRYLDLRGNPLQNNPSSLFRNLPGLTVLNDRNETRFDSRFFMLQRRWFLSASTRETPKRIALKKN